MRDFVCGYHSIIECGFEVFFFGSLAIVFVLICLGLLYDAIKRRVVTFWNVHVKVHSEEK